jgi:hypothetical protein
MPEEAATTTRPTRPTRAKQAAEPEATPASGITAAELREFAVYRRAQLYRPRLGGQIGGAQAINAQRSEAFLAELEVFATWLENGRPGPVQSLTEAELTSYRAAKAAGAVFPAEIEAQL